MHEYYKSQNVYVNCYNTLKTFKLVWTSFCELKGSWVCNFMSKKIMIKFYNLSRNKIIGEIYQPNAWILSHPKYWWFHIMFF